RRHICQIRAFSAQQFLLLGPAFSLAWAKEIDTSHALALARAASRAGGRFGSRTGAHLLILLEHVFSTGLAGFCDNGGHCDSALDQSSAASPPRGASSAKLGKGRI